MRELNHLLVGSGLIPLNNELQQDDCVVLLDVNCYQLAIYFPTCVTKMPN